MKCSTVLPVLKQTKSGERLSKHHSNNKCKLQPPPHFIPLFGARFLKDKFLFRQCGTTDKENEKEATNKNRLFFSLCCKTCSEQTEKVSLLTARTHNAKTRFSAWLKNGPAKKVSLHEHWKKKKGEELSSNKGWGF